MPQSLVKNLVHIVFSTKNRQRFIDEGIESELFRYFNRIIEKNGSRMIIAGAYDDHVHILVSLGKYTLIPDLVGAIKRSTSVWIKRKGRKYRSFYWQGGYGAFSVGQSQVPQVTAYIRNQRKHHATVDFQTEYRQLLDRYELDYDERYVWD